MQLYSYVFQDILKYDPFSDTDSAVPPNVRAEQVETVGASTGGERPESGPINATIVGTDALVFADDPARRHDGLRDLIAIGKSLGQLESARTIR